MSIYVAFADIKDWREAWLCENDPQDGTDCVTPFDKYFYGATPVNAETVSSPLTLDDVSKRIDAICEAHLERCKVQQDRYAADLESLATAVEASPDLNKNAVGMIVLGRVRQLITEVADFVKVAG